MIDDQTRNITGTRCEVEHAQRSAWLNPIAQKSGDQGVASEETIQLPQILQIHFQLVADRLRKVHQFRLTRIKLTLHSKKRRLLAAVGCHFKNFCHDFGSAAVSILRVDAWTAMGYAEFAGEWYWLSVGGELLGRRRTKAELLQLVK